MGGEAARELGTGRRRGMEKKGRKEKGRVGGWEGKVSEEDRHRCRYVTAFCYCLSNCS